MRIQKAPFQTTAVERGYRMKSAGKDREGVLSEKITNPSEGCRAYWVNDLPLFGFMSAHRVSEETGLGAIDRSVIRSIQG